MTKEKQMPMWTTLTTPENVAEIHRQLFAGVGPYEIAKKVQGMDPPMFVDRTINAVTNWFSSYRTKFVQAEQTRALMEVAKYKGAPGLRKRLDVIAELEELAVTHRERLAKGLKMESNSPIPLDAVSKLALTFGTTLEKLAHLYLETGLMHRVPKKVEASLSNVLDGRPLFSFTEEERQRWTSAKLLEDVVLRDEDEDEDGADGNEKGI